MPESKSVHYEAFGPFPLQIANKRSVDTALATFWQERTADSPDGLANAVGIYVWMHEVDGQLIPWNVGLTNRQGFKGRFEQKKKTFLQLQLDEQANSVAVFLLALKNSSERGFRKPTVSKQIATNVWLEKELIKAAMAINPKLRNKADTRKSKVLVVDGFLNDGGTKRSSAALSFAKLFSQKG